MVSSSLDALEMGPGTPIFVHEWWPSSTVSHIRSFDEGAQHTFFFPSQRQPSAPSRTTASGKSFVNFGFTALFDSMFLSQSPIHKRRMAVYPEEPSEPAHCSEPTFFLQALHNHLDGAAAIFLMVCQEFERVDQIVAASLWCRVRSKIVCISAVHAALRDQNPGRSFPIVLAATRRPPSTTLLLPVSHLMCSSSGKQ